MKTPQEFQDYIKALTADPNLETRELENAKLLLLFYMAGIERKDMPLDALRPEVISADLIPEQFHTTVAQLAVLKDREIKGRVIDYAWKHLQEISGRIISFLVRS